MEGTVLPVVLLLKVLSSATGLGPEEAELESSASARKQKNEDFSTPR